MEQLDPADLKAFVEERIQSFHDAKRGTLERLKLDDILKRKNPYLFRAKNLTVVSAFIEDIVSATLYASEEKYFGDFLEALAIFVSEKVWGGRKSAATGIDLEFVREDVHYLVSIKSGRNWGNSSQQRQLQTNFGQALRVIKQGRPSAPTNAVPGICYGKTKDVERGNYMVKTGQSFWEFVSGNRALYTDIIEPLGHKAKEKNDQFFEERARVINLLTGQFMARFCLEDGRIDWSRLVQFNSDNRGASESGCQ